MNDSLSLDLTCEFHGPYPREKMVCPVCKRKLDKVEEENKEAERGA
jgi:uncharacterized protein with PIN domain